jgi:hypothetical protein
MKKNLLIFTIKAIVILLLANSTFGWEVKIMGPSGTALAPDTEYGFGVWIRNPDAWLNDPYPELNLTVSGGTKTSFSSGTFDSGGGGDDLYIWMSNTLPSQKALIGYIKIKTNSNGNIVLNLTGERNGTVDI